MPPPNERAGNICVYLVSFLLFVAIIAGGAFLVLYLTLPESEDTIWFLIIGVVLVSMPWLFWTSTCLYRTVSPRNGPPDRAPGRAAAAAPATAAAAADEAAAGTAGSPEAPGGGGRSSDKTKGGAEDDASLASQESERPLFPVS